MIYKKYALLISIILIGIEGSAQTKMSKLDSIFLTDKMIVQPVINKGISNYKMPVTPEGFSLQLIGSDNLSVVTKSGAVFTPLNNMKVNLLFKATKEKDQSTIEIPVAVEVKGSHSNQMGNAKPFVIPSLREWVGGEGNLVLTNKSRIVVDAKFATELLPAATVFQNDLFELTKLKPAVIVGIPKAGDIFMSLDGNTAELGAEG